MIKRISVYPFDRASLPIIRNHFYPQNWQIDHLIAPRGYGIDGKDGGVIDYGAPLGLKVAANFSNALYTSDGILFVEPECEYNFTELIFPRIIEAIDSQKEIYLAIPIVNDVLTHLLDYAKRRNVHIEVFNNGYFPDTNFSELHKLDIKDAKIEFNTPVVFVMSLSSGLNKFAAQIALYSFLKDNSYNPLLITSRSYGELGGCLSIPNFMFDSINEVEKIILFRRFLKDVELKNNPDVMIIGIPGGIIPLDFQAHNNYGIIPFLISRAIQPDATLLCTYTEQFSEDYWNTIDCICKYRFSSEITAVIRYNALFLFSSLGSVEDSKFLLFDYKTNKQYELGKTPFPIFEQDKINSACEYVVNSLISNAESESF